MSKINSTDLGSINAGWVPDEDGLFFFFKLSEGQWLTITIPNASDKSVVEKLKFVKDKAKSSNINKHYIELLSSEFEIPTKTVGDDVVIEQLSKQDMGNKDEGVPPTGEYLVDGDAVVINNVKYTVGAEVTYGGYSYVVKKDDTGAYLAHPDGGSSADTPIIETKEIVTFVDYKKGLSTLTPTYSSVYARFNNLINSNDSDKVLIPDGGSLSRTLKASSSSTLRYWECFEFHSGAVTTDKVETITTGAWSGVKKMTS